MKAEDIRIRDPYIVSHDGFYYMYGTICETKLDPNTLYVYRSANAEEWENPKEIFSLSSVADARPETAPLSDDTYPNQLWAPEVHVYKGKFYLFVSILRNNGLRGTFIAMCDKPDGTFVPISPRPATPDDRSCIDGTFFVENGTPYIVYSHDWPDCFNTQKGRYIGEICAVELSADLRKAVGEPFRLFASDEAPLSSVHPAHVTIDGKAALRHGSDAPFVRTLSDGRLVLTWSPYLTDNYVVLGAVSENGIRGPWKHIDTPFYADNGGHAMFFTDADGTIKTCIHRPEHVPSERMQILPDVLPTRL